MVLLVIAINLNVNLSIGSLKIVYSAAVQSGYGYYNLIIGAIASLSLTHLIFYFHRSIRFKKLPPTDEK